MNSSNRFEGFVEATLKNIEVILSEVKNDIRTLREDIQRSDIEIVKLKVKVGIWGVVAGIVAGAATSSLFAYFSR